MYNLSFFLSHQSYRSQKEKFLKIFIYRYIFKTMYTRVYAAWMYNINNLKTECLSTKQSEKADLSSY